MTEQDGNRRVNQPAGHSTPWVDGLTLGEMLRAVAGRAADQPALVFSSDDYRVSYGELDQQTDEVARGLLALGVEHGDRVAVWSTNRPEWVLLQLGAARIGAVLVTVNPAFHEKELLYVLQQSGAKALFLTDRFKSTDYFATAMAAVPAIERSSPGQLSDALVTDLRWVVAFPDRHPECMLGWAEMLAGGADVEAGGLQDRQRLLAPSDPINLQYTSGTTGFPKGAMLSHRSLLYNGWYVGAAQRFTSVDRVCSPVPLYHCFGCVIGVLGSMTHGATLLVPAEYFDPLKTLDCMEKERATAIYGVPTMFIAELEHPSYPERDLSSLRTGIMAGAPCPVELMRRVLDDMGASEMTIAYGLTETSPVATQTLPDDAIEKRVETVGIPFPGVEVLIVEPGTGAPCQDGVAGEICIRGHNVMLGYYNMPEATSETIDSEGWLHSGDLGVLDADGYLRITGRIKDMLIRGGENIYPREIEEVLYQHPSVEQVEVIGVPDARLGEEVCAWVKVVTDAEASADDLRDFCRSRLAHFKVPRYVVFTDDFPTTVSGKVQKFKLREQVAERLATEAAR